MQTAISPPLSHLNVKLLGYPEVSFAGERIKLPTQKVQAILYFLAVRQEASREELAELLWEPEARHRLRPELHRLKNLPSAEVWLELEDTAAVRVQTDLALFEQHLRQGKFAQALQQFPERALLLQGFSLEDSPAFMDWLEVERERITNLYREALRGQALELSKQNQLSEALDLVRDLLDLDPLDESVYRLAMRLEYARGHVQAALQHYDRCRRMLAEELGIEPLAETLSLAAEIQKGSALPDYQIHSETKRLPKAFLRPPSLIAREAEWARLEAAFQHGQAVFISGPAGSGKTRLMLDFARSKGDVVMAEGRIGDANIPFSSMTRVFRNYLEAFPDRPLEPWVHQALSRVVDKTQDSLPAISEADKTRLYEAIVAFFAHAISHLQVFPTDNLHHFDPLSAEVANRAGFEAFSGRKAERCAINTFRPEAMPPDFFPVLEHFVAQGAAIHIELQPLGLQDVRKLLGSLELEDKNDLAIKLHRLTGGNPQFLIETLKSLHATGQLDNVPERIAPPERLGFVLRKRLDGLSTLALRIAKAVATIEHTISTDTLAEVLDLNAFDVAEGVAELEQAQVFVGNQFVHDVLQESAKGQTPAAVQRLLHKRMASLLERQTPDAARIAHHYQAADEPDKALPWRLKAIQDAMDKGFRTQALGWLEWLLFDAPEESKTYAQALVLKGQLLLGEDIAAAEACFQKSLELSRYVHTDVEATALEELANCASHRRDFASANRLIQEALKYPLEPTRRAALYRTQGIIHSASGRYEEADTAFKQAIQNDPGLFIYQMHLASLRWHQGRIQENITMLLDLLRRHPAQAKLTHLYHNISTAFWASGQVKEALGWAQKSLEVWGGSGNILAEATSLVGLGRIQVSLGLFDQALQGFQKAQALFEQVGVVALAADAQIRQAYLYNYGNRTDIALSLAHQAVEVLEKHPEAFFLTYARACLGNIYAKQRNWERAREYAEKSLELAEQIRHPLALLITLPTVGRVEGFTGQKQQARALSERAANLAEAHGMREFLAFSLIVRSTQSEDKEAAIRFATQSLEIGKDHDLAVIRWQAARVLVHLTAHPEHQQELQAAMDFLAERSPKDWSFERI